jgi:ABC-type lipoprotein release transport system permease subunit
MAASFVLTRYLTAVDPVTFVTLAVLMALVSGIACYIPARRAAHVDPLTAIRTE